MSLIHRMVIGLGLLALAGPGYATDADVVRQLPRPPDSAAASHAWRPDGSRRKSRRPRCRPRSPSPAPIASPSPFGVPIDFADSVAFPDDDPADSPRHTPGDFPAGKAPAMTMAELSKSPWPTTRHWSRRRCGSQRRGVAAFKRDSTPTRRSGTTARKSATKARPASRADFIGQEFVTAGKLGIATWPATRWSRPSRPWRRSANGSSPTCGPPPMRLIVAERIVAVLNEQLVQIGESAVKTADQLLAAKEVSRVDLLQAQIEANSAKVQLRDAQNRHQAAWRRLTAILGVTEMEPVSLGGNLEDDLPELSWQTRASMC